MQEHAPGDVIQPQKDTTSVETEHAAVSEAPSAPTPTPARPPETDQPNFYHQTQEDEIPDDMIVWEADEFISQEKPAGWYGIVIVASVAITAVVYLLNRDMITAGLVLVALIGLAVFSGRRPKRQQFSVSPTGIQVGRMFYSFADFRSFAVAEEKEGHSLVFTSLKRFIPAINVYIPPEYEESVVNLVASILPMEAHKPDMVERFISRIHF